MEILEIVSNRIMCRAYGKVISHRDMGTLQAHVKSRRHVANSVGFVKEGEERSVVSSICVLGIPTAKSLYTDEDFLG